MLLLIISHTLIFVQTVDDWSNYQIFGDIWVTQYDITYMLDI